MATNSPSVQAWIRELVAENKQLRETVEQLQKIVNRNSQNSSQPPSHDRPEQKPAKEPSGSSRKRDGTLDYFEFLGEFPAIQTQIRHWLMMGLTGSSLRTTATCRRLLVADPDLWRFASVPGLERTNNSAERALRHPVIWRCTSHGTQPDSGSRFVKRTLTAVETFRQQQRPVFDFVRDALIAYRIRQPALSLLPPHQP